MTHRIRISRPRAHGLLALAGLSLLCVAPASAEQFGGSKLFVNHSMKYDVGRTFGVGANFTIAPVRAAQQVLVKQLQDNYPNEYDVILQASQRLPPEALNGDKSWTDLKKELVAALPVDQRADAEKTLEGVPLQDDDVSMAQQLVGLVSDQDTTITFSIEPFAEFHLGFMDVVVTVPLAGFAGDATEFALGNLGADFKFGESWGKGISGGISGGIQYWAPTATSQANALGLANLMWSPRYFNEYTTLTPYVVGGVDLMFVTLQASLAYNTMFGVKGDPEFSQVQYLQWGGSVSITAIPFFIISAEFSGLHGLKNAAAYESVVGTFGLRFAASVIDIGLGFQVPFVQADPNDFAAFSNLTFGAPADFNTILSLTVGI